MRKTPDPENGKTAGGDGPEMPGHAYVPGLAPRHPDDAFATVRASVLAGAGPEALRQSAAWQQGLAWLDAGYYWEAHELFEPVWSALPPNAPERRLVQALIQIANAGLKLRMGRPRAAARLIVLAQALIAESGACTRRPVMGLRPTDLEAMIATLDQAKG